MEGPQEVTQSIFQQEYEMRNEENKAKVRSLYYARAMNILREIPFQYSEKICNEVAEDILDKGAKLMTNASVEEDDDDKEMNELNNMGDTFQGLQSGTCLFLTVDKQAHEENRERVEKALPMPSSPRYNVKTHDVSTLPEIIEKMKSFIIFTASRSLSALIVVLGKCTEDGVVLAHGATVPRNVLEDQARKILDGSEEYCPLTLDMVFVGPEGELAMSTIQKGQKKESAPKHLVITA